MRGGGNRWSRSRSRSQSFGSRSRSSSPLDGVRLHVADLGIDTSKKELEKLFGKFGSLEEVWMARTSPRFAFVVFKHKADANEAVKNIDGMTLHGCRMRVTHARPRTRGRGRRGYDPNSRCYQCGERGHFSRDCNELEYGYRRPSSRSPDRRHGGRNQRPPRREERPRSGRRY